MITMISGDYSDSLRFIVKNITVIISHHRNHRKEKAPASAGAGSPNATLPAVMQAL
jgi:hypothetical protein